MAARINELTQFVDSGGEPLVNGKIYIGTVGLDPVANLITIYSDRALTVVLTNPQTLDADGRSTNKIWIPGKYSMQVNDLLAVQHIQDLDAGEDQSAGLTTLTNIQGADTITAEGVPAITGYIDKQLYTFIVASVNTTAVTINIDAQGAKTFKRNFDLDIVKGQFKQNQAVIGIYNETQDVMEWVNHNNKVDYWNKGANIASAATVDLSLATGNSLVITGATGPITSFGTTPAGSVFNLTFTGTPTINHNGTSLIIPGQGNLLIVAGDQVRVESLGSGDVQIQVFRKTGQALNPILVTQADAEAGTASALKLWSSERVRQNVEAVSALVPLAQATASNSASVDFFTNINSTYEVYLITINDLQPVSDNSALYIKIRDNGSVISGSAYQWSRNENSANATSVTDAEFELTTTNVDSALDRELHGHIWIFRDPGNRRAGIVWNLSYDHSSAIISSIGGGTNPTGSTGLTDLNGIRLQMSTGNISTGNFKLYGVRNS